MPYIQVVSIAPFNPPSSLQAQLLDDFSNPTLSLRDIAAAHSTTLSALSAFISRPDIQALLETRKDVASERVQLIALDHLPPAIAAASSILSTFHSEEAALKPDPTTRAKRADLALDYRARRTALYSASLLFRLSRPLAASPRAHQGKRGRVREANTTDGLPAPASPPPLHNPLNLAALEQLVSQLEALDSPADAKLDAEPAPEPNLEPALIIAPDSVAQHSDLKLESPTPPAPTLPAPTGRQPRRAAHLTALAGLAPGP